MHYKHLKQVYDKQIRSKCSELEKILQECFLNNCNKEDYCKTEVNIFKKCLEDFNLDFKQKYKCYRFIFN